MSTSVSSSPVLTLESLAREIRERAQRAFDVADRYSGESDADLCAVIGALVDIADRYVWSSETGFEDDDGLGRLRHACAEGNKAWSYLRSGAPAIQRTLTEPSDDDRTFILERLRTTHRTTSPYCQAEGGGAKIVDHLRVPGAPSVLLRHVLFKCASLSHARRVLRAIGLKPLSKREGEGDFLEVLGETIVCYKSSPVQRR